MSKVKLGIIGVGNMGTTHSENIVNKGLCPEIELVAVADVSEKRRTFFKENFPNVKVFESGSELIKSGLVEAVVVATPHYDHPTYCIEALENGIHALSEKPAGVYTKAVKEMNEVARKSGKTFAMMFNQRAHGEYKALKEIVSSGELGEVRRVNWIITTWFRPQSYYDSGAWRATWNGEGGGVLLNQCPHNLDLLQWICGMPVKVQANMYEGKWHDIEVEDDVSAFMEFENGATGVFVTTTGDTPGTNRLEITMDGGKLVCEKGQITLNRLETKTSEFIKTSQHGFNKPVMSDEILPNKESSHGHTTVLNAFAANILRGEPLIADGTEGINGLTLSNAMHLSSWLGKTVDLPFDEDLFLELLNKKRATSKHKDTTEVTFSTEGSY